MGWADSDTHYAFVMLFGKDLVLLHDVNQSQLLKYRFSHHGPESPYEDNVDCFVGAFTGENHFQVVTA